LHAWQWYLENFSARSLLLFHVPNGELRDHRTAEKLKRMGVVAGVADFLAFTATRRAAIELKDSDGGQSADQIRFERYWTALGGEYYLCRSLDDFKNLLTALALF
jgi:hypothetical protein